MAQGKEAPCGLFPETYELDKVLVSRKTKLADGTERFVLLAEIKQDFPHDAGDILAAFGPGTYQLQARRGRGFAAPPMLLPIAGPGGEVAPDEAPPGGGAGDGSPTWAMLVRAFSESQKTINNGLQAQLAATRADSRANLEFIGTVIAQVAGGGGSKEADHFTSFLRERVTALEAKIVKLEDENKELREKVLKSKSGEVFDDIAREAVPQLFSMFSGARAPAMAAGAAAPTAGAAAPVAPVVDATIEKVLKSLPSVADITTFLAGGGKISDNDAAAFKMLAMKGALPAEYIAVLAKYLGLA